MPSELPGSTSPVCNTRVTATGGHNPGLKNLCGIWGFEARSSCQHTEHSYPLGHLSSPAIGFSKVHYELSLTAPAKFQFQLLVEWIVPLEWSSCLNQVKATRKRCSPSSWSTLYCFSSVPYWQNLTKSSRQRRNMSYRVLDAVNRNLKEWFWSQELKLKHHPIN